MTAQSPDPKYVFPTITVSTSEVARLAGLLIGAQEYLEALNRVAMFESRPRPHCFPNLRLARDVLVQWTRENVVSPDDCICPANMGGSVEVRGFMKGCPIHDATSDPGTSAGIEVDPSLTFRPGSV